MAQPAFDDSAEKLETFCTLLGQTSAVLTRDAEVLDARSDGLERTEAETRKRCERIAEHLTTALGALTEAHENTVEQADRLTEAAQDLASARLSAAEDRLESAVSSFEEQSSQDQAELEKDIPDLFETGFTSLATAIDEIEAELARAGDGAKQTLEELERAFGEVGQQVTESGAKTVAALAEAERAVAADGAQELEQQVAAHADLWLEELPEAVRAECASVGEPLEALYREWEAEVVAEGDELSESVADLLEDAADIVASGAGQPLATAAEETMDDCLATLAGQQQTLLPTLAEGEPASEAATALVDDLVVAHQVVVEIDCLLKALAE